MKNVMSYSIKIEDAAEKPWIIMVHGMSQDHRVFSAQIEKFKASFKLLAIDLPGHGLASQVAGPYGHIEMATHVAAEIHRADISNACYWGTHTGATIAPLVLEKCQMQINSLILEGPGIPGKNPPIVVENLNRAKHIAHTDGVNAAIDTWWKESCWFEAMRREPNPRRAEAHQAIVRDFSGKPWLDETPVKAIENAHAHLRAIKIPTLVYIGETDHLDFQTAADQVAAFIDPAQRRLIPEAGGFPAWECPKKVNNLVAEFLSEI